MKIKKPIISSINKDIKNIEKAHIKTMKELDEQILKNREYHAANMNKLNKKEQDVDKLVKDLHDGKISLDEFLKLSTNAIKET